jgi:hypothetical protein
LTAAASMTGCMSLSYVRGRMGSAAASDTVWFSQNQEHMRDLPHEMRLLLNT